ncbi:DMT family transporter [Desulfovibrio sp. OttesenSCG-928-A18]|nr:DMT family transporter [Desulfovibrio sp. OttesenSCG-928-A18]
MAAAGRKADVAAFCALGVAMLLWSGTFIAMKLVLSVFHPMFMIFVRMLASLLIMAPLLHGWAKRTPYAKGDWRIILLMVCSEPCLYFMFEAYALKYTTASQAGLITALLPLLVGVGAFIFLRERLPLRAWLGFFMAVTGVVALTLYGENSEDAPNAMLGNSLELCAMLSACVYTLCVRRLRGYPSFFITALQAGAGTLFFGVMLLILRVPLPEALPPAAPVIALGFLSMSTIVAYGFYNFGIARLSAGQAAAWINLIPALTLAMGVLFLGEGLSPPQIVAVAPIMLGVFISQKRA